MSEDGDALPAADDIYLVMKLVRTDARRKERDIESLGLGSKQRDRMRKAIGWSLQIALEQAYNSA